MARLLLLLTLAVLACHASEDPTTSLKGVHDLTPDTFDKIVNGGKHALVEFYAPWCGHCKRMTGEYKKLGELVEADPKLKSRVVVAKVNADEHRSLGSRFDVKGFPTIKFFPRGKAVDKDSAERYDGARSSDAFLKFLQDKVEGDKGFARVEALDELAAKAGKATKDTLKAAVEELEAAAKKLEGDSKTNADVYLKLAKKALDKGVDYFKTERARLERLIGSGSLAAAKLEEMARKSSVLEAFVGSGDDKKGEDEEKEVDEE